MQNKFLLNLQFLIFFMLPSPSYARYTDWQREPEDGAVMIYIFMVIAAGMIIYDSFKKSKASGIIAISIVLSLAYLFFTIEKARTIITLAFGAWFLVGLTYSFLKDKLKNI